MTQWFRLVGKRCSHLNAARFSLNIGVLLYMGFKTKEEAIEAWNTWKGRYETPDTELFRESNPCNACATIIEGDRYNQPKLEDMVASSKMLSNGVFTSPWPLLSPIQESSLKNEEFSDLKIEDVFSFRAR